MCWLGFNSELPPCQLLLRVCLKMRSNTEINAAFLQRRDLKSANDKDAADACLSIANSNRRELCAPSFIWGSALAVSNNMVTPCCGRPT